MKRETCNNTLIGIIAIFFVLLGISSAEKLKYKRITLQKDLGWRIQRKNSFPHDDIRIIYGAGGPTDSAIIMNEVYSYEKFHSDVLAFLESMPETNDENPKLWITLVPKDQPRPDPDGDLPLNTHKYDAAKLWNDLWLKLYPVIYNPNASRFNDLLEKQSPFIPITGEEKFPDIKIAAHKGRSRAEIVQNTLASLTPEQRIALGHPAEYPKPVNVDDKRDTKLQSGLVTDEVCRQHQSSKSPPSEVNTTDQIEVKNAKLLIIAGSLGLIGFLFILPKVLKSKRSNAG